MKEAVQRGHLNHFIRQKLKLWGTSRDKDDKAERKKLARGIIRMITRVTDWMAAGSKMKTSSHSVMLMSATIKRSWQTEN